MSPKQLSSGDRDQQERIDEYGELERQYQQLKPSLIDRRESLRVWIQGLVAECPSGEPVLLEGRLYQLQITPCRQESRWLDKLKVWRKLGGLKSLALWNISFRAVQDVIGEAAAKGLQVQEQTGYRTIKAVLKQTAVVPRAVEKAA